MIVILVPFFVLLIDLFELLDPVLQAETFLLERAERNSVSARLRKGISLGPMVGWRCLGGTYLADFLNVDDYSCAGSGKAFFLWHELTKFGGASLVNPAWCHRRRSVLKCVW